MNENFEAGRSQEEEPLSLEIIEEIRQQERETQTLLERANYDPIQ
ncbi:MAG: hypothetical protein WC736_15745 [Gallionella sp.]|jgi:hypothetical protein